MNHRLSFPLIVLVTAGLALSGCSKSFVTGSISKAEPGLLTASNGMTLYVFDKDEGIESSCYGKCAENWPPYLDTANEKKSDRWQLVLRDDGTTQWTFDGRPVYFFKGDAAAGDTNGDGKDGVWHTITRA